MNMDLSWSNQEMVPDNNSYMASFTPSNGQFGSSPGSSQGG
jgi:hypothetical protein